MFGKMLDEILFDLAGSRLLDHLVDLDELQCTHSIADAESRVRARVRLFRYLIREGWRPPDNVVARLERDEALLALPATLRTTMAMPVSGP